MKHDLLSNKLIWGIPAWWVYFCWLFLAFIVVGALAAYFENDVRVSLNKTVAALTPAPAQIATPPVAQLKEVLHIREGVGGKLEVVREYVVVGSKQ